MEFSSWRKPGGHASFFPLGTNACRDVNFRFRCHQIHGVSFSQRIHTEVALSYDDLLCVQGARGEVYLRQLFWPHVDLEGQCEFVSN